MNNPSLGDMDALQAISSDALPLYKSPSDADRLALHLQQASDAYYNHGSSPLSDEAFDIAKDHLEKIAPTHTFLDQVGAHVPDNVKARLPFWMGSMNKIRDSERDIQNWVAKYSSGGYVISDKLDGISAMITYDSAGRMRMYSRGDGTYGQDVSHLLGHLRGIPSQLTNFTVRGELIIPRDSWMHMQHTGANARNVVAGAMHRKTPDPAVTKHIDFVAYDILQPRTLKPSLAFKRLQHLGFKVAYNEFISRSSCTLRYLSEKLIDRRAASRYECDGIIVTHDDIHDIVVGKNPPYAFAFKSMHTHTEAEVTVSHVDWKVSKDGYIKPTINFPPTQIAGVSIQRATGFNASYIEANKIGPGARIVIVRSGDVIPHVVRVLQPAMSGEPQMPPMPFKWTDTHVDVTAASSDSMEQRMRELEHFVKTLNVSNVASGTIRKLFSAGFDSLPKLLAITENDLLQIEGFKKASAEKIYKALQGVRKNASCVQLMAASNIFGRGLGQKKLMAIVKAHPKVLERHIPTAAEIETIEGIGPITAQAFCKGLAAFFAMMDDIGIPCHAKSSRSPSQSATTPAASHAPYALAGKNIVFTGFRAKQWEDLVVDHGGEVTSTLSKHTHILVALDPSKASSKLEKARKLGISVISKQDFETQYMS